MFMYKRSDNLELIGYSDSDFVGCVDSRKSIPGYIFILAGGAICWRSSKQIMTATSTMEAEFVSGFEATSHGVWLKSFILGLRIVNSISTPLRIYVTIQLMSLWLRIIKVGVEVSISTLSIKL